LGSSAIYKVSEKVGSAKIRIPKVPTFPGTGSEARFPSKVPKKKFPKIPKGSQEQLSKLGSQEQVPKGFQEQAQARFPGNMFPSKVP
jgi:hypothetical protein